MVVLPSVNRTMIFCALEAGSNSSPALVNASAWLVEPAAVRLLTAAFKAATDVISWVSCVAVLAKLTTAIRLPPPIWPSWLATGGLCKDVNEGIRTGLHAGQRNASHALDRSSTRTISAGFSIMSGFCCERNRNFQRAITWDLAGADSFVRMNDAHIGSPPIGHKRPCHFMTKRGRMCNSRRRSPPAENVAPD